MPRMQDDQPHAFRDALLHALDDLVGDVAMRRMAPPEQHIGCGQTLGGQAVLGLLQGCRRCLDCRVAGKGCGDRSVHAVGIEGAHFLAGLLVDIFAPDHGSNRHVELPKRFGRHSSGGRWR